MDKNTILKNLKNDYFFEMLFSYIKKKKALEILKYNKNLKKRLNISIGDYKKYCEQFSSIEIELVPIKNSNPNFINIDERNKEYFHIYFNDDKNEEIKRFKRTTLYETWVEKITIIIDYQIDSLNYLFFECRYIESIRFKKFLRTNITSMYRMFYLCKELKKLDLSSFNTKNVTNMSYMFFGCELLKEINLTKFDTSKVTDMDLCFLNAN